MSFFNSPECKKLREHILFNDKEIGDAFSISEDGLNWILKIAWMDGKLYKLMMEFKDNAKAKYIYNQKEKYSTFIIPKTLTAETKSVEEPPKEEEKGEGDYALSRSMKGKLGQLVPCLKDAEGNVFDGFHRIKINPSAWTVKLDHVKTASDRALARMTVNFCRRHYTVEEMTNDIGLLIGSGLTVQQISEATGISERTVYRYMPPQLKDQKISQATSEAKTLQTSTLPAVTPPLKTQDTVLKSMQEQIMSEMRNCEKCGQPVHRTKMSLVQGLILCPKCAGKTTPPPEKKTEDKPVKPKETGEYRRALMHPQKSEFELAVIQGLQAEGMPLETDVEICVVKTIPDAVLRVRNKQFAIYIDNEVTHPKGNGRDEFLREKIKAQNWEIVPIRYKGDTKEERLRARQEIREALRW